MSPNDNSILKKELSKTLERASLLESEISAIKTSRSYRVARLIGTIKQKLLQNPKGELAKAVKMGLANPKKLARILIGKEANSNIQSIINNDVRKYHDWIILNEPDEEDLEAQKKFSDLLEYKPFFSIITPVFNPPKYALEELIQSVLNQTYPYFELCLGNFGDSVEITELLRHYQKVDSRVKVLSFKSNRGISENSNSILKKVKGDFIVLLDHDDTIAPNALFENANILNKGDYDFIYSDKDKINDSSQRFEPIFKPEWSPDILLNVNYLTHLNAIRTSKVKEIGGWDPRTDGAQDWDLFLRVIETTERIAHIPKVLYHWRVISTSTAFSIDSKPYALEGQRVAINKYLKNQNILAESYHSGKSELFLKWEKESVDQEPLFILLATNYADLLRSLNSIKQTLRNKHYKFMVVHSFEVSSRERESLKECKRWIKDSTTFSLKTLQAIRLSAEEDESINTIVFMDCSLKSIGYGLKDWYSDLTGWLSIEGIGAVGAKVIDSRKTIVEGAGIVTSGGIKPLFHDCPDYFSGPLGNIEWIRDLLWISTSLFAIKTESLECIEKIKASGQEMGLPVLFNCIYRNGLRLIFNPKISATCSQANIRDYDLDKYKNNTHLWIDKKGNTEFIDPYSNPNVDPNDPMKLKNVYFYEKDEESSFFSAPDMYSEEALISSQAFDLTTEEVVYNKQNSWQKLLPNTSTRTIGWFLPTFDGIYAGLNNIFSFAQYLQDYKNLISTFFILKNGGIDVERKLAIDMFPSLAKAKFVGINSTEIMPNQRIPLDIGVCTLWSTAYVLAKYRDVKRKCYFIQDNETNFYPKGTVSSLVDVTYKLNYFAIANTPGLLNNYKQNYQGKGDVLLSKLNLETYLGSKVREKPQAPYKVFFYGRPLMPRNAFELGISSLKELKKRLGDDVHIYSAGADWIPENYGVEGIVNNLGKLSYESLPSFYRKMDVGLMFMFSGHPGVVASELMASGCPVVVNEYDDLTWNELYQNEITCLKSLATPSVVADNLERCLKDVSLRSKIIPAARKKVIDFYKDYEKTRESVATKILNG